MASRLAIAGTALCLWTAACRHSETPHAVDPALAACIPRDAVVIAGADLKQLRTSPFAHNLPPSVLNASYILGAMSGGGVTLVARGDFAELPAGWRRIGPNVAMSGDAKCEGAPQDLLPHAESLAADRPLWMVARGSATLPLSGNFANLNNFLHATEYATVAARAGNPFELEISGVCRTLEDAAHLERTIRAFLSLASRRDNSLSLPSVKTRDLTVYVRFSAAPETLRRLLP